MSECQRKKRINKKFTMPQKIENKDIFSPDFLEPQKKSFKEII